MLLKKLNKIHEKKCEKINILILILVFFLVAQDEKLFLVNMVKH